MSDYIQRLVSLLISTSFSNGRSRQNYTSSFSDSWSLIIDKTQEILGSYKTENIILQMLSATFVCLKGKTCQTENIQKPPSSAQLMCFLWIGLVFDLMAVHHL